MSVAPSRLGSWDYVTFIALIIVASCIGVYHVFAARKSKTTKEFLVKSHDLGIAPLILSTAATFTSAIGLLGFPVETYSYGASFMVVNFSFLLLIPLGIFLYLPVFYELGISSIFQYLELRFSRGVRLCASTLINIQLVLYTSCVMYAPALALNQVTGLHLWASVASIGVICIIYTSMGGIKAVVWADVTQVVVMISVLLIILIKGTADLGGISEVWRTCTEGNRTQFFIWTESPHSMYSFWSMAIGGTFHFLGVLATNQLMVQRYVCNKTLKDAKISFVGGAITIAFLTTVNSIGGLIMYSRYHDCDPLIDGQVTSRDQIMALFAMETLSFCTGLPGVFVAAILCATLSTLSSSLNSLSTMSIEDYIKPCYPNLSDKAQMWISKLLAMGYGIVCVALVLVAQSIEGLIRAVFIINGATGGPVLTLFTMGMALPWINTTGAICGFFAGLALTVWASVGTLILNPAMPTAPFNTNGCNISTELTLFNQSDILGDYSTFASTIETHAPETHPYFYSLYTIPSIWYASWSVGTGLIVAIAVSMATGPKKIEEVDPKLLFPLTRRLCSRLQKKYQDFYENEAGHKSYLQISLTDPDISSNMDEWNTSSMLNGDPPGYFDSEMVEKTSIKKRINSPSDF